MHPMQVEAQKIVLRLAEGGCLHCSHSQLTHSIPVSSDSLNLVLCPLGFQQRRMAFLHSLLMFFYAYQGENYLDYNRQFLSESYGCCPGSRCEIM